MIAPDTFRLGITEGRHSRLDAIIKGRYRNLNVNHVFGRQPRHRRRADVVNPQGQLAQSMSKA